LMNIDLNLTNKQYELIGRIASSWGYIDFLISKVLHGMTGLSEEDSFTMIHSADMRTKLDWVTQIMSDKLREADKKAMREVCSEIDRLSSERNLLSHMVVMWDKTFTQPSAISFKRNRTRTQELNDDFLENIRKQMEKCSEQLLEICIRCGYVKIELKE
jgi:hypothetical protein